MQTRQILPVRGRRSRSRWLLVIIFLSVLSCVWLPYFMMPTTRIVRRVHLIHALRHGIENAPGFANVWIVGRANDDIDIFAPNNLSPIDKERLECLIAQLAPGARTHVSYTLPVNEDPEI